MEIKGSTPQDSLAPIKVIGSWIVFFILFIYSGAQVRASLLKTEYIADTENFHFFILHFISYYLRVYIQLIIILIITLLFIYTMYMLSDAIATFQFPEEKNFAAKAVLILIGGIDNTEKRGMIHRIKSIIDPGNYFLTLGEDLITCHYKPFFIGLLMAVLIAIIIWFIYKRKLKRIELDQTYIGEDENDENDKKDDFVDENGLVIKKNVIVQEQEAHKHKFLTKAFRIGLTLSLLIVMLLYLFFVFQSIKKASS